MLDFVIFAVTFVTGLIIFVFYLYPGSRKSGTSIPGMEPSDAKEGNLADIVSAGSIHEFLTKLHSQYGPIASFWMGTRIVVSLASPELFQQHQHVFDRPEELFEGFKWMFGANSIYFANGAQGRIRHENYSTFLTKLSQNPRCQEVVAKLAKELVEKLESLPAGQHVPLGQCMTAFSMKALSSVLFGEAFGDDNEFLVQFEILHTAMEAELVPQTVTPDTAERETSSALKKVRVAVENALKNLPHDDINFPGTSVDDCVTIIENGYHSLANLLTWALYYIASHEEVQSQAYAEIKLAFQNGKVKLENLRYTRQVINESLRMSALVSYTARTQAIDVEIGGHLVPKDTPVIHATGMVGKSDKIWTMPKMFDPDRFVSETLDKLPPLSFTPWGFAGKRTCPGQHLAINIALTAIAVILLPVTLELVEDQVVFQKYGLSTKPQDEIWVTITRRN